MPGEQHEAYLCANVPIMRRNAAALIAPSRDSAPPLPPPSKDLEVVKTASTGAMWAVDAKLAAVRATVAGGHPSTWLPRVLLPPVTGGLCVASVPTRSCSTGQHTTPRSPTPLPPSILSLLADDSDVVTAFCLHEGVTAGVNLSRAAVRMRVSDLRGGRVTGSDGPGA